MSKIRNRILKYTCAVSALAFDHMPGDYSLHINIWLLGHLSGYNIGMFKDVASLDVAGRGFGVVPGWRTRRPENLSEG